VENMLSFGSNEVTIFQQVIYGVAATIEMEKKLSDKMVRIEHFLDYPSTPPLPPPKDCKF
jgi:hypothetical protein